MHTYCVHRKSHKDGEGKIGSETAERASATKTRDRRGLEVEHERKRKERDNEHCSKKEELGNHETERCIGCKQPKSCLASIRHLNE